MTLFGSLIALSEQQQYVDMWIYECLAFVLYALLRYVFIGKIQIFVNSNGERDNILVISLHTNDTVRKLKQLIQDKKGIPPDQQSLYITGTGKRLLDEQELTISDFG
jgi:hypothetical protein